MSRDVYLGGNTQKQGSESHKLRGAVASVGREGCVIGRSKSGVVRRAGKFLFLHLGGGHMSIHFRIIC